MAPKKLYTFAIDPDLAKALKRYKAKTGLSESEQIRQALRAWFQEKGVMRASRRRAETRRRPRT